MRNIYRATYLFLLNTPTITADSTIVIIVKNAVSNERLANICPIYFSHNDYKMMRNILNISVIDMLRMIRKLPERFSLGSFLLTK